jgi:hypothetical protein
MIPDPFQNGDPLWQPFTLSPSNTEFAMPDTTASSLSAFLRSDEVQNAMATAEPRRPPAPAREPVWQLAHIPGFPH